MIQQQLSERLLLAELSRQKRQHHSEEVQANVIARKMALGDLSMSNVELNAKKDELISEYERNVVRLQEKHEAGKFDIHLTAYVHNIRDLKIAVLGWIQFVY